MAEVTQMPPRDQQRGAPPHNLEAELAILGACLYNAASATHVFTQLEADDFYKTTHQQIYRTMRSLHSLGAPLTPISVSERLRADGRTQNLAHSLHEALDAAATPSLVAHYTQIIAKKAQARATQTIGHQLTQTPEDAVDLTATIRQLEQIRDRTHSSTEIPARVQLGGTIFDEPEQIPAIWGHHQTVLWSEGEPLLIGGPTGTGKTTLCQRIILARMQIGSTHILDEPVAASSSRVLYIAADRPRQAKRSMRRMCPPSARAQLDEQLAWWEGPLDFDVADEPDRLVRLARACGAETLIIDSLKDVAMKLIDDERINAVNRAWQTLVASGIDVCILHHERKRDSTRRRGDKNHATLDDVYGNQQITAGMGSVLWLDGNAGDTIIRLHHLKQPADPVGPLTLLFDRPNGDVQIQQGCTPLDLLRNASNGMTARDVARTIYATEDPNQNDTNRTRNQLNGLVQKGLAHKREVGAQGQTKAIIYHATTPQGALI